MAIAQYLQEIEKQRNLLKENLAEKEVAVEGADTFNSLISKIPEIPIKQKTDAQNGVWTPTVTSDSFSLKGLKFLPAKLAVCCEDVLTKNFNSVAEHINIAILNVELTAKEVELIKNDIQTGITVETEDIAADITVEKNGNLYNLSVSFAETNKTVAVPYRFKANASHVWCVSEEGWLI